jgi:hypothetical protein
MNRILPCLFAAALSALASPVCADVTEVERGFPATIEDAYPLGYMGRELQVYTRYERGHDGSDRLEFVSQVEIGFPKNAQIVVSQPFLGGNAEPDGVGDTEAEFFYNFNQETRTLPAFAGAVSLTAPTNDDSHGVDPAVELVATKTLPGTWHLHQLHANFRYQWNDDVQPGERDGRYMAAAGYSVVLNNETLLVLDLVREEDMTEDEESNLAEVGVRYQLTPRTVISGGVGFGFGEESPDARGTIGLQLAF